MRILFHSDALKRALISNGGPLWQALDLCKNGHLQGWALASALVGTAEDAAPLRRLLDTLSLLSPTPSEVREALLSPSSAGSEVALAALAARGMRLDAVVTDKPDAFAGLDVAVLTPETLLERAAGDEAVSGVGLLDIPASYPEILNDVEDQMADVMRSGHFVLGPKVTALEKKVAEYCQAPYAVGVSSGTDALLIALMAAEIGAGDEVITTPYTFFATVGSIVRLGARPVFVDIDEATFNIDPAALEAAVTERTRAILPVHLYGQAADMDPIMDIAGRHGLTVIEDAAQGIGTEYKNRRAGSFSRFGCFSFFPTKNLGGFGDGGMVTAATEDDWDRVNTLRAHGSQPKYYHKFVGGNFRLDALQAAVVLAKIKHLPAWTERRRANAERYRRLFEEAGLASRVGLPREVFAGHTYNQFVIRVGERRDGLREHLAKNKVGTEIYYPLPLHLQECFKGLGHKPGDFPESEKASRETLALPISQEVTAGQQEYVVEAIARFMD